MQPVLTKALQRISTLSFLFKISKGTPDATQYQLFYDRDDDDERQRSALKALFKSAGGSQWREDKNWLVEDQSYCNWERVECCEEWAYFHWETDCNFFQKNDILRLDFSLNKLNGFIPSELGDITQIINLSLSGNELTGKIPTELARLDQLAKIIFTNNMLTGIIPNQIGSLTKLEALLLEDNLLTGTVPTEMGLMTGLETLRVNGNNLRGSIPIELDLLSGLFELELFNNDFTGAVPPGILASAKEDDYDYNSVDVNGTILEGNSMQVHDSYTERSAIIQMYGSNWRKIHSQNSSYCSWKGITCSSSEMSNSVIELLLIPGHAPVSSFSESIFDALTDLRVLIIDGEIISEREISDVLLLTYLPGLVLTNNALSDTFPLELFSFTKLEHLVLQGNDLLSGSLPTEIGMLTTLKELEISNNGVNGFIPSEVGKLVDLSVLKLENNRLYGTIPAELWSLDNIDKFNIDGNSFDSSIIPSSKCLKYQRASAEWEKDIFNDMDFCLNAFWTNNQARTVVLWLSISLIFLYVSYQMMRCKAYVSVFMGSIEKQSTLTDAQKFVSQKQTLHRRVLELITSMIALWSLIASLAYQTERSSTEVSVIVSVTVLIVIISVSLVSNICISINHVQESSSESGSASSANDAWERRLLGRRNRISFQRLTLYFLLIQLFCPIIGIFVALHPSTRDAYGVEFPFSSLLGWTCSNLIFVCTFFSECPRWPFLLSIFLVPPSCFINLAVSGNPSLQVLWAQLTTVFYFSWGIPVFITSNRLQTVIDINERKSSSDEKKRVVVRMVRNNFIALIPILYLTMHSATNFCRYATTVQNTSTLEYLGKGWSQCFLGNILFMSLLSIEVWKAARLTLKDFMMPKVLFVEKASLFSLALLIFFAIALESGLFISNADSIYAIIVAVILAPLSQFFLLHSVCSKIVKGNHRYFLDRNQQGDLHEEEIAALKDESTVLRDENADLNRRVGLMQDDINLLKNLKNPTSKKLQKQ